MAIADGFIELIYNLLNKANSEIIRVLLLSLSTVRKYLTVRSNKDDMLYEALAIKILINLLQTPPPKNKRWTKWSTKS